MPFIVFEGLDGSGKSTLIKGLDQALKDRGLPVAVTREPGGTPLGDEIRKLLLNHGPTEPVPRAELLLYEAARAQHVEQLIRPELKRGAWVLCDRFAASSLAFQCGGRGIERSVVSDLNEYATAGLNADLTVLVNVPLAVAQSRVGQRAEQDRFETEDQAFHRRVQEDFLRQANESQDRWLVMDANGKTPQQLVNELVKYLEDRQWL